MFDEYVKGNDEQKEEKEKGSDGSLGFDSLLASMKQNNNNNEDSQARTTMARTSYLTTGQTSIDSEPVE